MNSKTVQRFSHATQLYAIVRKQLGPCAVLGSASSDPLVCQSMTRGQNAFELSWQLTRAPFTSTLLFCLVNTSFLFIMPALNSSLLLKLEASIPASNTELANHLGVCTIDPGASKPVLIMT